MFDLKGLSRRIHLLKVSILFLNLISTQKDKLSIQHNVRILKIRDEVGAWMWFSNRKLRNLEFFKTSSSSKPLIILQNDWSLSFFKWKTESKKMNLSENGSKSIRKEGKRQDRLMNLFVKELIKVFHLLYFYFSLSRSILASNQVLGTYPIIRCCVSLCSISWVAYRSEFVLFEIAVIQSFVSISNCSSTWCSCIWWSSRNYRYSVS